MRRPLVRVGVGVWVGVRVGVRVRFRVRVPGLPLVLPVARPQVRRALRSAQDPLPRDQERLREVVRLRSSVCWALKIFSVQLVTS